MISVNGLHRRYGKTIALNGISFEMARGEIYAFVGPNGAGKSTTMRILGTLEEPDEGTVTIDGMSLIEHPEYARKHIGYMPDSLPSHYDITIHDYIDFYARVYGIKAPERQERVAAIEDFCNLAGIRDKHLRALSKGMKQRVSLARALIHDPKFLLMDEPAAGLDPRARIELRELIRVLADQGKTILISSHILSELAEICSSTLIIEQGEILRSGALADIIKQSASSDKQRLQTMQVRAIEPVEKLQSVIANLPNVDAIRVIGNWVEVDLEADDQIACDLLKTLMNELSIVEFHAKQAGLEEVFMNVTEGLVQ